MKKNSMYGLSELDKEDTLRKIKKSKDFITNNGIELDDGTQLPYAVMVQNSWHNSYRYIAEINHRVESLTEYANEKNLKPVFVTFTLPSEYHRLKTLKSGKLVKNPKFIDDEFHTPKAGSLELTSMVTSVRYKRSYRDIPHELRSYFWANEPHKDGTPHKHVLFLIPEQNIQKFVSDIEELFPHPLAKVVTEVKNAKAYLMKYILKTFDDQRNDQDITDLTLWYLHHGIQRFNTSRTLVPLIIYRPLARKYHEDSRFSLLSLTKLWNNGEIEVTIDPDTNRLLAIHQLHYFDDRSVFIKILETRTYEHVVMSFHDGERYDSAKPVLRSVEAKKNKTVPVEIDGKNYIYRFGQLFELDNDKKSLPTPAYMKKKQLYDYYHSLDVEEVPLLHFGITQNEMVKRGLLEGFELQSLNDFNNEFDERFGF
jgi:hypothetical protein